MYRPNQTAPMPIHDIAQSKFYEASQTFTPVYWGTAVPFHFNSNCLGSTSEIYVNASYGSTSTFAAGQCIGMGGVLASPLSVAGREDNNLFLEYCLSCFNLSGSLQIVPCIGYLDDGLTATSGFHGTNNVCTNYSILPTTGLSHSNVPLVSCKQQILIRSLVSAEQLYNINLVAGFLIYSNAGSTAVNIDYTLSARYLTKPISTAGIH